MANKKTAKTEALAAAAGTAPAARRTRSTAAKHSRKATTAAVDTVVAEPSPEVATPAREFRIDHDAVAKLAYTYWLERGGQDGSEADDWFRAETELRRLAEAVSS